MSTQPFTRERQVRTSCRGCYRECGVIVHVKDGIVTKTEGDSENPLNRGTICAIGLAYRQIAYHPNRLKHPLKRIEERGEGRWERISWKEALDIAAARLKQIKEKYGAEAVVFISGTDRSHKQFYYRFCDCFGTPNIVTALHVCYAPRSNACITTFGSFLPYPEYENTKCVVAWGYNIWGGDAPVGDGSKIIDAKEKGAKLIVIDPRFSPTAAKADTWLQIRPGTDAALALGMLNVIIDERLYDKEFVKKWTFGFDKLARHVQEYSPEKVEKITWVPAEKIRQAARVYATTKPACIALGVAVEQSTNSTQACRAVWLLVAITGNYDVPGGNVVPQDKGLTPFDEICAFDKLDPKQRKKTLGLDKHPLCYYFPKLRGKPTRPPHPYAHPPTAWSAMLEGKPYPIKGALIFGNNTLVCFGNSKQVKQALMKLEFIVVADFFMTPTAELADLVLPAATWIERDQLVEVEESNYITYRQKVVEIGECWSDFKILCELSKKLELGNDWWNTEEDYLNYRLKPYGITFKQFKKKGKIEVPMKYKKYEKEGFATPSGKVEIYSNMLEGLGLEPLPSHREPPESPISTPELARSYPLILTTGARYPVFFHSEHRQAPWLLEIYPENDVEIHPETARSLSIKEGDACLVETPRGRIMVKAKITEGIHPKVVHVHHGWWYSSWEQANVNILTSNQEPLDPGSGSESLKALLCRVRKAGGF